MLADGAHREAKVVNHVDRPAMRLNCHNCQSINRPVLLGVVKLNVDAAGVLLLARDDQPRLVPCKEPARVVQWRGSRLERILPALT